ncbi:alpha-2-macroglobulin, partial [Calditrichota bacterium]
YQYYVGVQKPSMEYGHLRTGMTIKIPVIVVNHDGAAISGRALNYRVYKDKKHWWWEYDNYNEYKLKFKSDTDTELLTEGNIISRNVPVYFDFTPDDRGQYLIEVQDGDEGGHISSFFVGAYPWGEGPAMEEAGGTLTLITDKQSYNPGDEAVLRFPAPNDGSILFSLQRGTDILKTQWYEPPQKVGEMEISVPITKEMAPTAYASISIIQPHNQTLNDRPIRMYGVVPINVEDALTHQNLKINMPDELESEETFNVEIQNLNKEKTQFTIAVVDEGLLDITRFKTPDPWSSFFRKLRMGINIYDLYSLIIGANKGDVFKTFSIGGELDEFAVLPESQDKAEQKKRFKPVSMFKGPITTNENGFAEVEFKMPNYIGSVRVMVVSARGNSYGHIEKTVPVTKDLMVMPTLPKVLGPEDKISVPVTIFAMKEDIGKVDVSIKVEGPLSLVGSNTKIVEFKQTGEKDIQFELKAKAAVGFSKVILMAKSTKMSTSVSTDLEVRASSPRLYESYDQQVVPGNIVSLQIPDKGLPGSNQASISIQRRPNMDFSKRLDWLIRYPYGCIEQTISSVFPQLYLKEFLTDYKNPQKIKEEIDGNINSGIRRLRRFQLPSGAFTYWPGNRDASNWGTDYAGYFLIEAKRLGYHIPADMMSNLIRYETSQARKTRDKLIERVFRVYLLALSGKPELGAMNLLKENNLKDMTDTEKWTLAAAYKLAGVERTAAEIIINAGMNVKDYNEFSGTYGSGLRDQAMILEKLVLFEYWSEADNLVKTITSALSGSDWYSTQTTGYTLLALGKYLKAVEGDSKDKHILAGYIELPSTKRIEFSTESISYNLDIDKGFDKNITIYLDPKSTVKRAFVTLNWEGVPLKSDIGSTAKNLNLKVEWLDEDGMAINQTNLRQGQSFWGHFNVSSKTSYATIDEVALVQIIPAGWEIENTRLSQEMIPTWMGKWQLNRAEYVDIRDDRIMWFFDLRRYSSKLDFVVKLNAVTIGDFELPPTIVEAMYNNNYKATKAGHTVSVRQR